MAISVTFWKRGLFDDWAGNVCRLGWSCLSTGWVMFVDWAGDVCRLGWSCLSTGREMFVD